MDQGTNPIYRGSKISEPPTFAGSESGISLNDWLEHVALYFSATSIVTDKQKIVYALTRVRHPAQKYLNSYYRKNEAGEDLGSWTDFRKQLNDIYGQRDAVMHYD